MNRNSKLKRIKLRKNSLLLVPHSTILIATTVKHQRMKGGGKKKGKLNEE